METQLEDLKNKIKVIGRAMLSLGLQNTHSGNISLRTGNNILITKTGSMKGHLENKDIISVGLDEPKAGIFQASSETGTHKKILRFARSAIHAHSLSATLLSFKSESIIPVDCLGRRFLEKIPVVEFEYPVGSPEMEKEIPTILQSGPAMVVKSHGPFVCGSSLEEAFFTLCILDYSAKILLYLNLLKTRLEEIDNITYPPLSDYIQPGNNQATEDRKLISQFIRTASDVFSLELSPFHTGSLSVKDGREMIYTPALSSPVEIPFDILRISLDEENKDFFTRLHQAVYRYSSAKSALFTHSPWATVQALKLYSQGKDRIIPADAEGSYFYPAVPIISPKEKSETIVANAARYKMVALAGLGVLAIGHTPGYTIHHCSSLKNICFIKTHLELMQQQRVINDITKFLDERGKSW